MCMAVLPKECPVCDCAVCSGQLLLGLGLLPLLPLSLSVKPAKEPPSNSLLLTTALQYILFHSFKVFTYVTCYFSRYMLGYKKVYWWV